MSFAAQACVLGTRVVNVLGVIYWSVVAAGAEKSVYTVNTARGTYRS